MAGNYHDLYSRGCMMQSMTTTTSSNGMINDQDGASTCQKPTWSQSLIPRFLPIVNVLHRQLANQRQPRRQHQDCAVYRQRKHHQQQHGEPSKLLLRRNKLQYLRHRKVEKTKEKVKDLIHTVVATGIIKDTMGGDTNDKST